MQTVTNIDYVAWVGLILGFLNLIWNIINTFISNWYTREHVKLTIRGIYPYFPWGIKDKRPSLTVNIVNMSSFSIYINALGFCPHRWFNDYEENTHRVLLREAPVELKPHAGMNISVSGEPYVDLISNNKYMYVKTVCEKVKVSRIKIKS